jgi:thioredoxin 1
MKTILTLTNKNFNKEVIQSQLPVFVEFTTEWCGTSHISASIIHKLSTNFKGITKFCQINIDEYEDIANKYGINKIPTILFFNHGKVVEFVFGSVSKEILIEKLLLITNNKKEKS